jgi:hypothetical protein
MSEFIEILSPSALKDLQTANAEIVTMISNVDKVGTKMKGIATPSGSDSAIKSLTQQYKQQETVIAKTMRALENETKSRQALDAQRQKALTVLDKEEAKLKASENVYNKVQAKLNALSNEYKALATRKELGATLTDKEAKRYDFLLSKIQTYDKTLKAVDATMGKYTRNVGNYASGFNPISNSINQLTREMPAFTYSVQTGFMALSNNIPIFTDAIGNAVKQNKELIAQGQPTTSVLKQVAGALLSWQTLMGVGITLLTVYGKEIGDWIGQLTGASSALEDLNKNQKEFNDAKFQGKKDAQSEIIELRKYLAVAKDAKLSDEERNIALKQLRSQYPFYFKELSDNAILTGNVSKSEKELMKALEKRKDVEKKTELNVTNRQKLLDIDKEKVQLLKDQEKVEKALASVSKNVSSGAGSAATGLMIEQSRVKKRLYELDKQYIFIQKNLISNENSIFQLKKETIGLEYQENKDSGKAQKDRIDLDYAEIESKYKLRIAKLELLKAQQEEIAENENATDFGRLEARKEFSRLEAEIITANYELQTELSKKQFDDENKEAKRKYEENKKNGYNDVRNNLEFAKAKQDILNKYLNDTVTATENRDKQIFDLMLKDAEFAEKIRKVQFEKEEDHRKKTLEAERELALALNKVEQKKFLKFSEDTKRTVKARQLAFLEYKRLALAQLDLEMTIELAKADPEKYDVIRQKYAELRKAIEELITPFQKIQQETENWINSFKTKPINDFQKALEDAGLASLKMFTDFDEAGETTFSKMMDYAKNSTEQMKVALLAVSEVGQDVFNLISEASNASFKNEYANLEKQKNISLAFAGENEEARAEVERQAEERRKQIARREFQAKKKQAKANIAIDMAQALIALWIKPGFPKAIPMAGVVAGLAIAQMAMVDAQQMPEFWKGTDNAPEGWALTQEKGRELILDKNNNLKSKGSDKGATKTWLNKGDKVIPHEKTMEYLMFNNELNGMLTNNQISEKQPIVNVNSGMSDAQVDRIVSSIKNKSELHIIKDKFGERSYERKQRQTVEIANARVNFKSSAV